MDIQRFLSDCESKLSVSVAVDEDNMSLLLRVDVLNVSKSSAGSVSVGVMSCLREYFLNGTMFYKTEQALEQFSRRLGRHEYGSVPLRSCKKAREHR